MGMHCTHMCLDDRIWAHRFEFRLLKTKYLIWIVNKGLRISI